MAKQKEEAKQELPKLVVMSRVKDIISAKDLRCSGDLEDALNRKMQEVVDAAMARCKGNERVTVRPEDV